MKYAFYRGISSHYSFVVDDPKIAGLLGLLGGGTNPFDFYVPTMMPIDQNLELSLSAKMHGVLFMFTFADDVLDFDGWVFRGE